MLTHSTPEARAAAYAALRARNLLSDLPMQVDDAIKQGGEFARAMIELECIRQRLAAERRQRVPAVFRKPATSFRQQQPASQTRPLDFKSRAAGERDED